MMRVTERRWRSICGVMVLLAGWSVGGALAEAPIKLDAHGARVLSELPPAGVHPRLFFTADEYPAMKQRQAAPRFKKAFAVMRRQTVDSCSKGQWRRLAEKDFETNGVTDRDILDWFKAGEGRNIAWGLASVHSILADDKALQAVMRRMIANYARVILASKKRAEEGTFDGPLAAELKGRLSIWTHNRWDVGVGWTFGASGYATAYDVLYHTMSQRERSLVRQAIAAATRGRKSYGNGMPPGFASSNHYGYHGDLAVMLAAIEGEPGFDRETWNGIVQVLRDYWEKAYTPLGYSREDGYGPNLGLRGGGRGYMVLARRGYNIFATEKYRRYLDYVAMDWDPYPGGHLNGGASGGPYGGLYPTSTLIGRYMYPRNVSANFTWRHLIGESYQRRIAWQGLLDYLLYASDWRGPASREEMLKRSGLPLSVHYPVRGKVIARSDWSSDAMYLTFDARPDAHLIGHDKVDRGNVSLSALGRVWAFSGDFHAWDRSDENSLVHVDGKAQPWKAPSVRILWYADDGKVAGAGADLKYAYDWQWSPPWPKWGQEFPKPWEPETRGPLDLGWPKDHADPDLCPKSIHGSQTGYAGRNNLHRRPYNPVRKAQRSAFLVRAKRPCALICDDIRKDDKEHLYEWYMQLPIDLKLRSKGPHEAILAEEGDGGREMLVRFLQEAPVTVKVEDYVARKGRKTGNRSQPDVPGKRLIASTTAVDPKFRVLLLPHKAGEALPKTTWSADRTVLTVAFPDGTETLRFTTTPQAGTRVDLKR